MNKKIKSENGITLVALGVTIIVLVILASITITGSSDAIKRANLEALKTNMLLVQAKAKEFVENAAFEAGPDGSKIDNAKKALTGEEELGDGNGLVEITDHSDSRLSKLNLEGYDYFYEVPEKSLIAMGVKDAKSSDAAGWYIVAYNIGETKVEVYNTAGYEAEDGFKYSLTDIEQVDV